MPALLPLMPRHFAIEVYETNRGHLLECINKELGKQWIAMSVFGFGSKSGATKPALVVLVQPGAVRDWNILERRIRTILPNPNILIEFLPGNISETIGISLAERLTAHPVMGSSIGEVGQEGCGTLGGYILLQRKGILHSGVLTNHHVVKPHSASENILDSGLGSSDACVSDVTTPGGFGAQAVSSAGPLSCSS